MERERLLPPSRDVHHAVPAACLWPIALTGGIKFPLRCVTALLG